MDGRKARAFTRLGYDWSHRYRRIVGTAATLQVNPQSSTVKLSFSAVPACRNFKRFERELGNPNSSRLILFAFNLLNSTANIFGSANSHDPQPAVQANRLGHS